jgi:hypothetical protein
VVRVKPTSPWVLVLLALVAGGLAYVLTSQFYADLPSPPTFAPLSLLLIALAEAYLASTTRARMTGRSDTRPIDPIFVAKLAALAKASSPVGALAFGAYTGFLVEVARMSGSAASSDTGTAALGMGCSLGLVAGALLLERVCRARPPDDETD